MSFLLALVSNSVWIFDDLNPPTEPSAGEGGGSVGSTEAAVD